jgi:hypothetical protein
MAAIRQVPWLVQPQEQLIQVALQVTLEVHGALTPEQIAEIPQLNDGGLALHAEMRRLCAVEPWGVTVEDPPWFFQASTRAFRSASPRSRCPQKR